MALVVWCYLIQCYLRVLSVQSVILYSVILECYLYRVLSYRVLSQSVICIECYLIPIAPCFTSLQQMCYSCHFSQASSYLIVAVQIVIYLHSMSSLICTEGKGKFCPNSCYSQTLNCTDFLVCLILLFAHLSIAPPPPCSIDDTINMTSI